MWPRSLLDTALILSPRPGHLSPQQLQGRGAAGSRVPQCWALTQPRAVYREMLLRRVWAEDPTGVKDRKAAMLLLLRDTLDHMSQRKHGPRTAGCLIYQPLGWNIEAKKAVLESLLKSPQLFPHTGNFPWGSCQGSWRRRAHRHQALGLSHSHQAPLLHDIRSQASTWLRGWGTNSSSAKDVLMLGAKALLWRQGN